MYDKEILISLLEKVLSATHRIIEKSKDIDSPDYYLQTPSGMERLESTCMLLIAIGESIKGIDKITEKQLLIKYTGIDWKGVMGMRDIIAHHYFDLDAEIVFEVIKNDLPSLHDTIQQMISDITPNIHS